MIRQCLDMEFVNSFMRLPEIRRYAAEFGAEDKEFTTDRSSAWLVYVLNGEEVGLIGFEIVTGCAIQFHPYILREFKLNYDEMVQEFFKWFASSKQTVIRKLNVVIPETCKGALSAAERAGMMVEGVDRDSWLTDFGACDRVMMGITREEIKL